jgi:hypothetical protein
VDDCEMSFRHGEAERSGGGGGDSILQRRGPDPPFDLPLLPFRLPVSPN